MTKKVILTLEVEVWWEPEDFDTGEYPTDEVLMNDSKGDNLRWVVEETIHSGELDGCVRDIRIKEVSDG